MIRVRFPYKPQINGAFSLTGKTSDCGSEEQGSSPESTLKCSVRIRVSTTAFLAVNTGSIPVQSTYWEDNDWLFTCIGGRRLQVRVLLPRLNYGSTPKLESRACL